MNATATVTESPEAFATVLRQISGAKLLISERQRVALELINDSLFPASPDAQLLIRVSAMEVLARAGERPEPQQKILATLLSTLDRLDAGDADKAAVRGSLQRAKSETIGQACRRKVVAFLGEGKREEFDTIYGARSRLIHSGEGRGLNTEKAAAALDLASALITADLGLQLK